MDIHIDLANKGVDALLLQKLHQDIRGSGVQRREDHSMQRPLPHQILRKLPVHQARVVRIREFCLLRKGTLIEPVGEQQIHPYAALLILRRMHMHVRERRNNQTPVVIRHRKRAKILRQRIRSINIPHLSVLHRENRILPHRERIPRFRIYNIPMQ